MTENNLELAKKKIAALQEIKNEYHDLIESDPVLAEDFKQLQRHLQDASDLSLSVFEKILKHLSKQIDESAQDHQRMDDEGQVAQNQSIAHSAQDYFDLKESVDGFFKKFVK